MQNLLFSSLIPIHPLLLLGMSTQPKESEKATSDSGRTQKKQVPVTLPTTDVLAPDPSESKDSNIFTRTEADREEMAKYRPPNLTFRQKYDGFQQMLEDLKKPNNAEVAKGFYIASFAMFILPVVIFFVVRKFVAPAVLPDYDKDTVGGFSAVASTIVITVVYGVWAIRRDARAEEAERKLRSGATAVKKDQ
jgi:hypothetical protein